MRGKKSELGLEIELTFKNFSQIQMTWYSNGVVVADYYFAGKDTTPFTWFERSKVNAILKGPNLLESTYE